MVDFIFPPAYDFPMHISHSWKIAFALCFILLLTAAVVTAEIHYMKAMLESSMQ